MTNEQPASGTDTGLLAILQHISDVQDRAGLLDGVMEAITYLDSEDGCPNGRHALGLVAKELAGEIYVALDTVNLPKIGGVA
ncbi:hypothetical protein Q4543_23800 [Salipiger sp. 1_MG-2023]|uniref:hypothetical protein n=1 Tax=Salipiger sp. 1_MG-2023 TaxID=3062665 RepID=UPI0026E2E289|nr:hypothetical protein [Salipiger sp. 1_MG-2023]MDO6588505.1 hypothetical protein [Salipiger sp. 1_MG-2023]